MRRFHWTLVAGLTLAMAGCVELEEVFTINPDGSGKVVIDAVVLSQSDDGAATPEAALQKRLNKTVANLLSDSEGVAAWENVSAEWQDDGRIHFTGTAFVDDIQKFDLDRTPNVELYLDKEGDKLTLRFGEREDDDGEDTWKDDPEKLSDEQLRRGIEAMRAEYQTGKPSFVAMANGLKIDARFELPGEVVEAVGVEQTGEQAIRHAADGDELIAAMERIMNQETAELVALVKQAGTFDILDFGDSRATASAAAQGLSEPPCVVIRADSQPQFDYQAAVAAARQAYPQLRKQPDLPDEVQLPGEPDADDAQANEQRNSSPPNPVKS